MFSSKAALGGGLKKGRKEKKKDKKLREKVCLKIPNMLSDGWPDTLRVQLSKSPIICPEKLRPETFFSLSSGGSEQTQEATTGVATALD